MGRPLIVRRAADENAPKRIGSETKAVAVNRLVRKARVVNFVVDAATGMTQAAIGLKYGVSTHTVRAELRWAQREGFLDKAEDAILNRLVPPAIDAYEVALKKSIETGDFEAADRVLTRLVKLFPQGARAVQPTAALDAADEISWERWTARRREQHTNHDEGEPAIDADVVASSPPTT